MAKNMYRETSADTNLAALANLQDINTITHETNGLIAAATDQGKRERFIEYFYDKMLLDTIRLGSENNVFLKHCRIKSVPKGNEKFLLRRWGGLTEHTQPLAEGIPPKSDRMASESFEGTYQQYGRYMEFTDRVEFNLIDDVIAHYSMMLGEVAVRTAERLCREELEASAGVTYANNKTFDTLVIGDKVGIADYRLQALKFARRLVKPLSGGNYVVICSPEHIYDLVNDPLVREYMEYTNTAEPYVTGQPVKLFNIIFEETMLDDYAYGYTEMSNPGLYYAEPGTECVRYVIKTSDGSTKYINVSVKTSALTGSISDAIVLASSKTYIDPSKLWVQKTTADTYLKDGSYIPNKVTINTNALLTFIKNDVNTNTIAVTDDQGVAGTVAGKDVVALYQLPVHKSFMFGDEFIYKTGIDGEMNAKFYVKEKGSAGVLDPIDQRQSVGFKINTLGFNTVRPEAMVQFISVPDEALTTYIEVIDELENHMPEQNGTPDSRK